MDLARGDGHAVQRVESEYVCEAAEAVRLRFVTSAEELNSPSEDAWFHPEFTHQHFGDSEQIFGYSDLDVSLSFTPASLQLHYEMKCRDKITKHDPTMKPDEIFKNVDELFADTQKVYTSRDEFVEVIEDDVKFRPIGQQIHSYTTKNKDNTESTFRVYMQQSPGDSAFQQYLARMQSFAFWFIDAAVYTDADDEKWTHFMLFEVKRDTSTGGERFAFAGYASIYSYYAYPEHVRPRIAQILVLPPFQKAGHGVQLLQAVYNQLLLDNNVIDITAEDPSENFAQLRDFVDTANCSKLEAFAPEKLADGFTTKMADEAKTRLKLPKKQARRVYEILRLKATDTSNEQQYKAYRLYVKQRLDIPFQKSKRDLNKLVKVLKDEELANVAATSVEQRQQQLQTLFDDTVAQYRTWFEGKVTSGEDTEMMDEAQTDEVPMAASEVTIPMVVTKVTADGVTHTNQPQIESQVVTEQQTSTGAKAPQFGNGSSYASYFHDPANFKG